MICNCFDAHYDKHEWKELEFHTKTQDTNSDGWKLLLQLIEEAATDNKEEFGSEMIGFWGNIVTLPPTIAKLKSVKYLTLYGSNLTSLPPEIGEMTNLAFLDTYTSYQLHWYPYEITRCKNLTDSRVSTRALYGNYKFRPPFPKLKSHALALEELVKSGASSRAIYNFEQNRENKIIGNCSVCDQVFTAASLIQVWISLCVATDVLPLLVNACSQKCIDNLPMPANNYTLKPHMGGIDIEQPPKLWL